MDGWRGTETVNCAVDEASDRGSPEAQCFKTEELAVHRGFYTAKAAGWGKSAGRVHKCNLLTKK